jgi:hypothetical protein
MALNNSLRRLRDGAALKKEVFMKQTKKYYKKKYNIQNKTKTRKP